MIHVKANPQSAFPEIRESLSLFMIAGLGWLVLGALISLVIAGDFFASVKPILWLLLIWALSLSDLYSTGQLIAAAMTLSAGEAKNRHQAIIGAFAWGSVKLACLGLLGAILFFGRAAPTPSLLLGLATLIVVPVAGGLWWHQRVLRHA